jgi:hypothetical protein
VQGRGEAAAREGGGCNGRGDGAGRRRQVREEEAAAVGVRESEK